MDKPIRFTWGNLLVSLLLVLIPIILTIFGAAYYFKGSVDTKMEYLEKQLVLKPDNEVILQFMYLTDERFRMGEKHDDESLRRLERLEQLFLTHTNRTVKKK